MRPVPDLAARLTSALLAALAVLGGAGCGDSDGPTPTPDATGTPAPTLTATPRTTPTRTGTIVEPSTVSLAMVVQGTAFLDGQPAAGGRVIARVGSTLCGQAAVRPDGSFELWIAEEDPDDYRGCTLGERVHFELGGLTATETLTLERRGGKKPLDLDLHFAR